MNLNFFDGSIGRKMHQIEAPIHEATLALSLEPDGRLERRDGGFSGYVTTQCAVLL